MISSWLERTKEIIFSRQKRKILSKSETKVCYIVLAIFQISLLKTPRHTYEDKFQSPTFTNMIKIQIIDVISWGANQGLGRYLVINHTDERKIILTQTLRNVYQEWGWGLG